jgi:hypothetical protein
MIVGALLCASPAQATPAEDAAREIISAINGSADDRAALVSGGFTSKALPNEAAAAD